MTSLPPKPLSAPDSVPAERPKTLGRFALPAAPPDLVPARMINEVLYCERLMYLEWSQGEFEDNAFTAEGREVVHARVDQERKRRGRRQSAPGGDAPHVSEAPPYRARSVWLSSQRLGMTGKIDLIDEGEEGAVVPVEYKRGKVPDVPERAYLPERAQVCAQALLLREHGHRCDEGSIYFAADRKRVRVVIDDALIATTREAARRAHELAAAGVLPPPLVDSPKCQGCSLVGICLPDEVGLLQTRGQQPETPLADLTDLAQPFDSDSWTPERPETSGKLRHLHAAKDDRVPLYVQAQGAYVALDAERLLVKSKEGTLSARLPNTSHVCLFGNVQISTPAVRALLGRAIPLLYFSYGGLFLGRTFAHDTNNIELRVAQHAQLRDASTCLRLARGVITSKILNCRTMLRRNSSPADETFLFELKQLARKASEAAAIESLLGIEGAAARCYFGAFTAMLKTPDEAPFDLNGRNRRPPRDPINALLSFAYSLLTKDLNLAIATSGLDPLLGFYHQPRFGRPALALDLMEEFRPLIADSVVIAAVNTGVVSARDFLYAPGSCALTSDGRKSFIQAYERRMDQLVTHPVFGYRVSYRRVLEVQARLLGRRLLGELDDYPAFRTR